jgi:raffinose/stachyose/melibiose transport system substrate-binding protein
MPTRFVRISALSLVTALALSGCAASAASGPTPSEGGEEDTTPVTIQLGSQTNSKPAIDLLVEKFHEEYPHITVQAQYSESAQYNSQITTQLAGGAAPDVFVAFPGTGSLPSIQVMSAGGALADLTDLGVGEIIPDELKPLVSDDKGIYSWPLGESDYFMIYNSALFDELDLEVPETIDDLLDLCEAASDAGKVGIVYGGAAVPTNGVVALSLASQTVYADDPEWTAQRDDGEVDFASDKGWNEALAQFTELRDGGCFNENPAGTATPDQFAMLAKGDALITFGHSQFAGLAAAAAKSNPDFELAVFPIPAADADSRVVPRAYPTQLVVNAASEHVDAAKKLIEFAMQPDIAHEVAEANGFVSLADAASGERPEYQAGIEQLLSDGRTVNFPLFQWPDPALFLDLSTNVQGLLLGQLSSKAVLTSLDEKWPTE